MRKTKSEVKPPEFVDLGTFDRSGKYLDVRPLDGYDRAMNVFLGPREPGKTAYFSYHMWKRACLRGETGIYLVRNPTLVTDEVIRKIRKDISHFCKVPPFYMNAQAAHTGNVDVLCEGFPIFHIVALNAARDLLKKVSVPNPSFILFDEFTRDTKAGDRYLKDEAGRFKELYATLVRERRGLKAYFCGNVYSLYNPYFLDWGVDTSKLLPGKIYVNKMCAVQMVTLTDELREEIVRKNPFYEFDDFYARYALDGQAKNDADVFVVPSHPRGFVLKFAIRTGGKTLGIYRGPSRIDNGFGRYDYWVGWTLGHERKVAYAFDLAELVNGTRMATKFDRGATSVFRLAMGARRVAFEDYPCYYLMEEIYRLL